MDSIWIGSSQACNWKLYSGNRTKSNGSSSRAPFINPVMSSQTIGPWLFMKDFAFTMCVIYICSPHLRKYNVLPNKNFKRNFLILRTQEEPKQHLDILI